MIPNLSNTLKITTPKEYVELRDTFDVIFMDMKITEPAVYLDKIYDVIKESPYLDHFKEHCMGYFPTYPKRMSQWYAHTILNVQEDEKQRTSDIFTIISRFADHKITAHLSSHTFPYINNEELKLQLKLFDKVECKPHTSLKYEEAFYQYAQKITNVSDLIETITDYSKDKQLNIFESLVEKKWFNVEKYQQLNLINNSLLDKESLYNTLLKKESRIDCLESLTPILLDYMVKGKITDKTLVSALSNSTEKNKYFIENLVTTQESANKAIDYSMKYECGKDINDAVAFVNYNLINHFNEINTLDATQVSLMISRCFIQRVTNPQFCDLIVNLVGIIKESDNELYKQVNEKINSDEKFYIYDKNGVDINVKFGTPEFKGFLYQLLFEKLNDELDGKPVERKIKI